MAVTAGRDEIVTRVQAALGLATKKEAEATTKAVMETIAGLIKENISTDGYVIKLAELGKFSVKHVAGTMRPNPFRGGAVAKTRDKRKVKFSVSGSLREVETV